MNSVRLYIILILLFLSPVILFAQDNAVFESWNGFSVSYEVINDFELQINQELRISDNLMSLSDYIAEIEAAYDISKHWSFGLGYRIQKEWDIEDGDHWSSRYYTSVQYDFDIERFRIKFREQYQLEPAWYGASEWSYFNFSTLRHKLSIDYNIKGIKLNPFAEMEFYQSLNHPIQNRIIKSRYTVGIEFPLIDDLDLELMFRYQNRQDGLRKPKQQYISGLSLKFDF
jgi:hypothetical protein